MQVWLLWCALVGLTGTSTCRALPVAPADPNVRMEQLMFESEGPGQISPEEMRRWMNDQPSHMTYQRVHGGLGP